MEFLLSVITEHIIFVFLICHVKNKRCGGIFIKYMVYIPSVGIIQIRFKWVETVTRLLSAGSDQLPFDNINLLSVVIMN